MHDADIVLTSADERADNSKIEKLNRLEAHDVLHQLILVVPVNSEEQKDVLNLAYSIPRNKRNQQDDPPHGMLHFCHCRLVIRLHHVSYKRDWVVRVADRRLTVLHIEHLHCAEKSLKSLLLEVRPDRVNHLVNERLDAFWHVRIFRTVLDRWKNSIHHAISHRFRVLDHNLANLVSRSVLDLGHKLLSLFVECVGLAFELTSQFKQFTFDASLNLVNSLEHGVLRAGNLRLHRVLSTGNFCL